MFRCPECGRTYPTSEGVDQHRAGKHSVKVFSDDRVPCPECGRSYRNLNALARHRRREHGYITPAPQVYEYDRAEDAYDYAHADPGSGYDDLYSHAYSGSRSERLVHGVVGFFAFLWASARWLFAIAIVVGVILAAAGVFDKEEAPEDPSSPGYSIVRDRSLSDEIDEYRAVEPDEGWDTEYEINDGDVTLRFRGRRMEMKYSRYAEDVVDAIERVAKSKGYVVTQGSE